MPDTGAMRLACRADIPALLVLVRALHAHEHIEHDAERCAQRLSELLDTPSLGCVLLMFEANALVGYALLSWCFSLEFDGRFALLDELFIAPEFRGGGRASRAIEAAAAHCLQRGISTLRLEVSIDNQRALDIYHRHGFRPESRTLMTRRLAGD